MTQVTLESVRAIDLEQLTAVVRKDQRSPYFKITQWGVDHLSKKGIINPEGLFLLQGKGCDERGDRRWSVVLKALQKSEPEPPLDHLWHWKREFFLAQSGLLDTLPGPVKAPRVYEAEETETGALLWMEYIQGRQGLSWVLDDYYEAARQIGLWNGNMAKQPLAADYPWLCRHHLRGWANPERPKEEFPENPIMTRLFSPSLLRRSAQAWDEREYFYAILARLPQIFSHFDTTPRNLIFRKSQKGTVELVAIDWAFCGWGPLGADLIGLIANPLIMFDYKPMKFQELEEAVFPAYLEGLRESGWRGNDDEIRLAYTLWTAMWLGVSAEVGNRWTNTEERRAACLAQFGHTPDECAENWAYVIEYALDHHLPEARQLIEKLGL